MIISKWIISFFLSLIELKELKAYFTLTVYALVFKKNCEMLADIPPWITGTLFMCLTT